MGAKDPLNMRTFLTLCLVAAAMAQGGVPHLPSYGEPNTVYCYHREDPTDHKCYEACATTDFNSTGITQPCSRSPRPPRRSMRARMESPISSTASEAPSSKSPSLSRPRVSQHSP